MQSLHSTPLGQHNTHRMKRYLSTDPGLTMKRGGESGFTTVSYSLTKMTPGLPQRNICQFTQHQPADLFLNKATN